MRSFWRCVSESCSQGFWCCAWELQSWHIVLALPVFSPKILCVFAVVTIAGFQEKVQKGDKLKVPLLEGEPGAKVTFDDVLLLCKDGGEVMIGTPTVKSASVEVAIQKHGKADKLLVYKMHRRKRYRRTKGHRQGFTEIEVTGIKG